MINRFWPLAVREGRILHRTDRNLPARVAARLATTAIPRFCSCNTRAVRETITGFADAIGVRKHLARGRDRLVDALNGYGSGSTTWRSGMDDRHLSLLLSFGLRRDSNCLDVGAHAGRFLQDFVRIAPEGRHLAYEPLPDLCADLTRQFPNVEVRQRALSNQNGEASFVHLMTQNLEGFSSLAGHGFYPDGVSTESITVTTERLDDHLPAGWLPDFVKIDVEGAEQMVLEGALETLREARPVIAFEHGWFDRPDKEQSENLYRIISEHLDLRLFDMDGHGPMSREEFLLALNTRWNWVAHR